MPSVDGSAISPSPQVTSSAAKRKWADYIDNASPNGTFSENTYNDRHSVIYDVGSLLQDIITVLKRYDTTPSILYAPLKKSSSNGNVVQPSMKRAKLSAAVDNTTIMAKFEKGLYLSTEELCSDVTCITKHLLQEALSTSAVPEILPDSHRHALREHERLNQDFANFRKLLTGMVKVENQRIPATAATNGHIESDAELPDVVKRAQSSTDDDESNGRSLLTLFGAAGGHKQLFSSFRTTNPNLNVPEEQVRDSATQNLHEVHKILPDDNLPTGISRTIVIPVSRGDANVLKSNQPKVVDSFAPPANLPPLNPPKIPRYATNRSLSITWSHKDEKSENTRTPGTPAESLTTGVWLGYGGRIPAQEPSSPEARRKQRDRALSTGEAHPRLSDGAVAAQQQASEEAAFRSVYSSFAPNRDDSAAIVPTQLKNQFWWQKHGARALEVTNTTDPELLQEYTGGESALLNHLDEETAFKMAAEEFIPDDNNLYDMLESRPTDSATIEARLNEISSLLETLHSYQRGRNSTLAAPSRTPLGQASPLQDLLGSPSGASRAEIEAFRLLKSRILSMISNLPPFAVSKLNGQQLADLQISRKIPVDEEIYIGIMEEDQISRLTKSAAANAAAVSGMASRGPHAGINHQTPGTQYASRTVPMSQPPRTNNYGQSMYSGQPAMPRSGPGHSRNSLGNWQVPSPTNIPVQRPLGQQLYNPQTPKSVQSPHRPPSGTYLQRPGPNLPVNGISHHSPYQPQSQPPHQQRSFTASTFSPMAFPPNSHRSQSPQKPLQHHSPSQQPKPSRSSPSPAIDAISQSPAKIQPPYLSHAQAPLGSVAASARSPTRGQEISKDQNRDQPAQQHEEGL